MPREVSKSAAHMIALGVWVFPLAVAGCASSRATGDRFEPVRILLKSGHDIIVAGDLRDHLHRGEPAADSSARLREFLTGPSRPTSAILRNPQGMALLGHQLLICDQGRPDLVMLDMQTGRFGLWGNDRNRPRCLVDVATDDDGHVIVADATAGSVLLYDADAALQERIELPDANGISARPVSVACHNGVLFVGDAGGHAVRCWSTGKHEWLEPIGPQLDAEHVLGTPTGLVFDADGRLLVVDALQACVFRIELTAGGVGVADVTRIGGPGRSDGQFVRPKQVAVSSNGDIWVTDAGRQSVLVFGPDGTFSAEIHEIADRWNGWTLPAGVVAISGEPSDVDFSDGLHGDRVVVSDSLGGISLTLLVIPDAMGN